MPFLNSLHRYPFLRLFVPLAVGIICGDALSSQNKEFVWRLAFVAFLISLLFGGFSFLLRKYSYRWLFGAGIYLLFFSIGVGSSGWRLAQTIHSFPDHETVYRGVLVEHPDIKKRSVLCTIHLLSQVDSVSTHSLQKDILLYFTKDSASEHLCRGDEVLFYAHISAPKNNGNPNEFDYARYLLRKGISGTGFAFAHNWKIVGHDSARSLKQLAADYRERILNLYRSLGFSRDEFAVLSALTVGYKDELSDEIKETFSISGASHVLALSGLHIGFLYAMLLFLLKRIPGRSKMIEIFRILIIIVALWLFAFLAGFSSSVVRSVMMFSLFALSGLALGKGFPLNTLAAAGVLMLLYNPCWLFDVGFQLSFCAVAAILLFHPLIDNRITLTNRFAKYVWSLISVSIAAQIGTAPLVLLYFSRYSTHFLLTNLLVIPLVSILIYLTVVMLLFTPFPMIQSWLKELVQFSLQFLNGSVRWVEQLPFSSIDNIWIYPFEVLILYLSILLFARYVSFRDGKNMIAFLTSVLILCSYHVTMLYKDRPYNSLVFYNVRNCPVVHCITASGRSWLVHPDDCVADDKRLYAAVSGYWNRLHMLPPISVLNAKTNQYLDFCNNILSFGGKQVCFVDDDRWLNKVAEHPLSVDYLYLCKGYRGRLRWLIGLFTVQTVVLDASIPEWHKKEFSEECMQMGIHFISLADKGSVCFLL